MLLVGTWSISPIVVAISLSWTPLAVGVKPRSGGRALEREPVEPGGVEGVARAPVVGAVAGVSSEALLAGDLDQRGAKAVLVECAVDQWREADDRRADPAVGEADHVVLVVGAHASLDRE